MNTLIEYCYRDAANYKTFHLIVAEGEADSGTYFSSLHEGDFFLPHDVGLPELQPEVWNTDDHIWHELIRVEATDAPPDIDLSAKDLASRFRQRGELGWDQSATFRRHGLI